MGLKCGEDSDGDGVKIGDCGGWGDGSSGLADGRGDSVDGDERVAETVVVVRW